MKEASQVSPPLANFVSLLEDRKALHLRDQMISMI